MSKPKFYYVRSNGTEVLRTIEFNLAVSVYMAKVQSNNDVSLLFGGRLISSNSYEPNGK